MSRRSVRKRRDAPPKPAFVDGRFDFDPLPLPPHIEARLRSSEPIPFDISFDDGPVYVPHHVRRMLVPRQTDRGFIHVPTAEVLREKMDLELGTLALVGSTYYRLEEALSNAPGLIDLATHPYDPGWSLRVADRPRRGYFRKVTLR